ncbi:hypothetical protein [Pseudomonas fluorescens]
MSDIHVKQGHHHLHVNPEVSISRSYLKEFKASLTEDDIAQILRAPNSLKSRKILNEMRLLFSKEGIDAMLKEPDAKEVAELLTEIGKFLEKNCDDSCIKIATQFYFSDYQAAYDKQKIALLLKLISGKEEFGFPHIFEFFKDTAGAFEQLNDSLKDTGETITHMHTITAKLTPKHLKSRMKAH